MDEGFNSPALSLGEVIAICTFVGWFILAVIYLLIPLEKDKDGKWVLRDDYEGPLREQFRRDQEWIKSGSWRNHPGFYPFWKKKWYEVEAERKAAEQEKTFVSEIWYDHTKEKGNAKDQG